VSEQGLADQLADGLTVTASGEADPFLKQAIGAASQDGSLPRHLAHDILTLLGEGHDAATTVLIFVALEPTSGAPITVGLLNIQAEPALPQITSALSWHEAQHARINNELARQLLPAIYATYQAGDRAGATVQETLTGILHAGGNAFDAATNHGREGDQEAAATMVIESITQTALTALGSQATGE